MEQGKNAFVDANGVLLAWGYVATNGDQTPVPVSDDFDYPLGTMQYVEGQWKPYTPSS